MNSKDKLMGGANTPLPEMSNKQMVELAFSEFAKLAMKCNVQTGLLTIIGNDGRLSTIGFGPLQAEAVKSGPMVFHEFLTYVVKAMEDSQQRSAGDMKPVTNITKN